MWTICVLEFLLIFFKEKKSLRQFTRHGCLNSKLDPMEKQKGAGVS